MPDPPIDLTQPTIVEASKSGVFIVKLAGATQLYYIYIDVAIAASGYFRRKRRVKECEGKTQIKLTISDIDPGAFDIVVKLMYGHELSAIQMRTPYRGNIILAFFVYHALTRLQWKGPALHTLMEVVFTTLATNAPSAKLIQWAFQPESILIEDQLGRLIVHSFLANERERRELDRSFPVDFLAKLMLRERELCVRDTRVADLRWEEYSPK